MSAPAPIQMGPPRRPARSVEMRLWLRRHRFVTILLWAVLGLGTIECILLLYFLSSCITLPTL
jgi:hypothetical protein